MDPQHGPPKEGPLGKNLAEGAGMAESSESSVHDFAKEMQQFSQQDAGHEGVSKEPPNLEEPKEMERGYPAKSVPKHGPGFSVLGKEDQAWIQSVHHKMGRPDPARFARFLQNTHASPKLFLVPWTSSVMPVWNHKGVFNQPGPHRFMRTLVLMK